MKQKFKINKKQVYSYEKTPVKDYTFSAKRNGDFIELEIKKFKKLTYKHEILIANIPKHRWDAHLYLYGLFGVYNESAIQNDNCALLARLADALHHLIDKVLIDNEFEVIEPNPHEISGHAPKDKLDEGFKVYRQSGHYDPIAREYKQESQWVNPDYPGYKSIDDTQLGEKLKKAIYSYALEMAMKDNDFLARALTSL